jgi:hypothetical protein
MDIPKEPVQGTVYTAYVPEIPNTNTPSTVPPKSPTNHTWHVPFFIIGSIIIVLVISILVTSKIFIKPEGIITTIPTPSDIPTPFPSRGKKQSAFAGESNFLQLESSIASFSSSLMQTNLVDSRLTPPVLDLPLGFTK